MSRDKSHARERARERYGLELTDADYCDMRQQCRDERGVCIGRKTGSTVKIWLVWWSAARRVVPVYYLKGSILSVLPIQAIERLVTEPLSRSYRRSTLPASDLYPVETTALGSGPGQLVTGDD